VALFTIVLDYKGGTYVRQVWSTSAKRALLVSLDKFDCFTTKALPTVIDQVREDDLVPVETVKHVWCGSVTARGHLGLFHMIKTAP
jgi:hypothetical protein